VLKAYELELVLVFLAAPLRLWLVAPVVIKLEAPPADAYLFEVL
jgi:hypothetical protein